MDALSAARRILEARRAEVGVASLLVLGGPAEGTRRLVFDNGTADGEVRDPHLAAALDSLGDRLVTGKLAAGRRGRDAGTHRLELPNGEAASVYAEVYLPPATLLIVGAGHLALPLSRLGHLLGYRVSILDDRPAFARGERFPDAHEVQLVDFQAPFTGVEVRRTTHVLLVTRGHQYDYECLRRLLLMDEPPEYVGMIGSRRRVRATFHQLREEGIAVETLERVRAPVGLDLGAETPEEIAVAVAAELVLFRRGGSGRPLVEVEGVARRFFGEGQEP